MTTVVLEDEYFSLFAPGEIDCHAWCPLFDVALGLHVDFCAVCGAPRRDHPDDAFPEDDVSAVD